MITKPGTKPNWISCAILNQFRCRIGANKARSTDLARQFRQLAGYPLGHFLDSPRGVVRALEMIESCKIIRQAVATLPEGPIAVPAPAGKFKVPAGMGVNRIEVPRGEVFYQVTSNGTDIPARVRVRTPTFMNMTTVRLAVLGQELSDSPLIQASCDPCYSCTDR
jgi:NADH:ubiquinone oxidoreductase subunit D